jgi:sulfur relay protein TusB/DsrH
VSRILHILREINQPEAMAIIAQQAKQSSQELSILLIQEAVHLLPDLPAKIYVLEEDARTRGVTSRFETINYSTMLDLIFSHDSVIAW